MSYFKKKSFKGILESSSCEIFISVLLSNKCDSAAILYSIRG